MIFKPFVHIKLETVYLVNYVEILLHDHFSGYIEIANPLGSFSSLGASPLGMKIWTLGIGNFNATLEMIVQYYNFILTLLSMFRQIDLQHDLSVKKFFDWVLVEKE